MELSAGNSADTVAALCRAMLRPVESASTLRVIEAALERLSLAPPDERAACALQVGRMARDADPVLRLSAMAAITGDLRRYDELLDLIDAEFGCPDLDRLLHIYCCMGRQLFLMRMDGASRPGFFEDRLFP